jgi:hypothetical protein
VPSAPPYSAPQVGVQQARRFVLLAGHQVAERSSMIEILAWPK